MTQLQLFSTVLACGFLGACVIADKHASPGGPDYSGSGSDDGGDDSGDDGSGSDNNSGGVDEQEDGADVLPTYPTQHPRIYVEANRARLTAALAASTPEATRFRAVTDRYVNGESIYEFRIWNARVRDAGGELIG